MLEKVKKVKGIETADVIVKKGDYHQLLAEAKKVKKVKEA